MDASVRETLELGSIRIDRALLAELCRRYAIKELSLFGSAARGEMGPDSDIDMLVEFEAGARIGMIKFERLAEELAGLAGRKVDLVTKCGLKPWVRSEILKDLRLVYAA
jgi:predicted nucleotidyltransferase